MTEEDLCAVFGCFQKEARDGQVWPSIRVMSGRMKGQAFVEFDSKFVLWLGYTSMKCGHRV